MKDIVIYKTFKYPDTIEECNSIKCEDCIKIKCGRNLLHKDIREGKYNQEVFFVNNYSKKEARKIIIDYIQNKGVTDLGDLINLSHIDLRLAVEIIDELKEEGKIKWRK